MGILVKWRTSHQPVLLGFPLLEDGLQVAVEQGAAALLACHPDGVLAQLAHVIRQDRHDRV